MTQEAAVLFLLRQRPQTCGDFIRSDFMLAASYRRAITMLRHKGYRIVLNKAVKVDGVTVTPARYILVAEPTTPCLPNGQGVLWPR